MTQMGLVAVVEHAPADTDAAMWACHFSASGLSAHRRRCHVKEASGHNRLTEHVHVYALCGVVDSHVDGPGGHVANYHGAQAPIHATKAILLDYGLCGAEQAVVESGRRRMMLTERALGLELSLDDV